MFDTQPMEVYALGNLRIRGIFHPKVSLSVYEDREDGMWKIRSTLGNIPGIHGRYETWFEAVEKAQDIRDYLAKFTVFDGGNGKAA